ncbi:hypothetical protein ACFVYT_34090 [Streptomyces sp. NPDC058290]|uniref:hypothetical protein n=1 Tax=Streptomyces sp. NPDC058290 TaxID=3346426 RepID=UPI0036E5936C
MWVDPPVRYWLWAIGLAVDLLIMLTASGSRMVQSAQERVARTVKRYGSSEHVPVVEAAYADVPHLVERLGAAAGAFALAAVVAGASWRRILLWALPCLLLTLLLALAAGRLGAVWLLWGWPRRWSGRSCARRTCRGG